MEWLQSIFCVHSPLQAVIVLSVIIALGLGLGKIHVFGISLGVTWVFFAGILAGHLGLSIDSSMLHYAESFGLVLFVYELGLKVGPGFFSSFRKGGIELNMLGLGVVLLGTVFAVGLSFILGISMNDMVGILSGATTNTPALGRRPTGVGATWIVGKRCGVELCRHLSVGCDRSYSRDDFCKKMFCKAH